MDQDNDGEAENSAKLKNQTGEVDRSSTIPCLFCEDGKIHNLHFFYYYGSNEVEDRACPICHGSLIVPINLQLEICPDCLGSGKTFANAEEEYKYDCETCLGLGKILIDSQDAIEPEAFRYGASTGLITFVLLTVLRVLIPYSWQGLDLFWSTVCLILPFSILIGLLAIWVADGLIKKDQG